MARFDLESMRDEFLNLFKTKLNDKIAEISTEKGDSITLDTFSDEQYVNDLNSKVMNYDEFVFYSFGNVSTIPNYKKYALEAVLNFEVVFVDRQGGALAESKLLRYTRAMADLVYENIEEIAVVGEIEVELFTPVTVQESLDSPVLRVAGIGIRGTIA